MAENRSYATRLSSLWQILSSQPYQEKLRSKSPNLNPAMSGSDTFILVSGESQIVKPDTQPNGIVFVDSSFLIVYEKWSKESDALLGYKYHYQRLDGWFIRYDMHEVDSPGHPKHHLQASILDKKVRLPTGEVRCEDILEVIIEQFVS